MRYPSKRSLITAALVACLAASTVWPQIGIPASSLRAFDSSDYRTRPLSKKQLSTWAGMMRLVDARDENNRIKHPALNELWRWLRTSSTPIRIVFANRHPECRHCGGRFVIEEADATRGRTAIIILFSDAIDETRVPLPSRKEPKFKPMAGLSRVERYASVLGHEIAHARWFLASEDRVRLYFELERETTDIQILLKEIGYRRSSEAEPQRRARRLSALLREIEDPATEAEEKIWLELLGKR